MTAASLMLNAKCSENTIKPETVHKHWNCALKISRIWWNFIILLVLFTCLDPWYSQWFGRPWFLPDLFCSLKVFEMNWTQDSWSWRPVYSGNATVIGLRRIFSWKYSPELFFGPGARVDIHKTYILRKFVKIFVTLGLNILSF